jgi:glucose/arabinose dehydrogenase
MQTFLSVLALLGWATAAAAQIGGLTIASGLQEPVAVIADPASRSQFFVVEQDGLVRLVRDGVPVAEPFLDLRHAISTGGERGLLGMALALDFLESGRFFVNFTNTAGHTVIARFRRRGLDAAVADPGSRFDLVWPDGRRDIVQPFSNHNGGHLAFGPDGFLYIGLGDGGSAGDPGHRAQNPQTLLGKMLRIDVNVPDDHPRGYVVPIDNPFLDGDPIAALAEIWSFGWRNPWRYAFDDWTRGGTAALIVGDVGQGAREEIDFEPSGRGGRNYGWRLREGRLAFDARLPAAYGPLVEPIHDYGRGVGQSITGGLIYRGAALDPSFGGRYFYADYVTGRVFSIGLHLGASGEATMADEQEHTGRLGGRVVLGSISSFGADHDGELLIANHTAGTIVRVAPDFTVVPHAPTASVRFDEGVVSLKWEPATAGVASVAYLVERVRSGAVIERRAMERPFDQLELVAGDCFRVRGQARTGPWGPPSPPLCVP